MPQLLRAPATLCSVSLALSALACQRVEPPEFSYYDERIAPVIEVGCAVQTTGCHRATADQAAVGNLDLTSYDALSRRGDALPPMGPYEVGQLLLKGGNAVEVAVQTFDPPNALAPDQRFVAITTDVRHAGGKSLRIGSDGYARLKSWIAQGHTRDGTVREHVQQSAGACRSGAGEHPGFDPARAPDDEASFKEFVSKVQPVLVGRCAGSACHGSPSADLYLSCGVTEAEQRWNYFVALAHTDASVSLSELLRRPLSKLRGGTYHEGGSIFLSTGDSDYLTLRRWIEALVERRPDLVVYQPDDPGLRFFGNYVQPMFVKKGCMFQNCHSPAMFHELQLRGGSQGTFSRVAFDRNYEMSRHMLALESANPNDSRLIAKNLFPPEKGGAGVAHRGGPLFEDFQTGPASAGACANIDVTKEPLNEVPAYCVLVQWHALERSRLLRAGKLSLPSDQALLWVSRPLDLGDPRDFDTYRPGADLRRAALTLAEDGRPVLGPSTSLLSGCGLSRDRADVRGPAVSWDGQRLAFAARSSSREPLRIYEAQADGSACAPLAGIAASQTEQNGILTHDFDPAYAPDGRIVFASTRGNLSGEGYSYAGPQRTPSQLAPNANLYVFERKAQSIRQLTFLLNQEIAPAFTGEGRVIFTAEKRAPEFFQLAGRRINLDGSDFHPLFAQRDSVGFAQATEIVQLPNGNLALVAAPEGARDGAGTLAIVNRSLGPDQDDRDPRDAFYLHSLTFPRPGALDGREGAFRSPAALPSSFMIASCELGARDLSHGQLDFDLCAVQPHTGQAFVIAGEAGRAEVEAVALYARENRGVFVALAGELKGKTRIDSASSAAEVHLLDVPLLGTLLFSNTRTGRPIDPAVGGFDVLESLPPDPRALSFAELPRESVISDDHGTVFVHYEELGHVATRADGSAKIRFTGGHPILLRLTDQDGAALSFDANARFSGEMIQREEIQFYPGEHLSVSFRRPLFNGICAGCHGSITGHELDIAVKVDVLTSASLTESLGAPPTSLP